jgi:hypothetical protein
MLGSLGKQIAASVTCRNRCRQFRDFLQDVPEKFPIGIRLPSDSWTRPISEPRPIDSNSREGGRNLLSQGTHFEADRNRTECRKHEDCRAVPAGINSNLGGFTAPRPVDVM